MWRQPQLKVPGRKERVWVQVVIAGVARAHVDVSACECHHMCASVCVCLVCVCTRLCVWFFFRVCAHACVRACMHVRLHMCVCV